MGCHIILRDLLCEINEAKFYTILADEITSHNVEQLALCVRFVDSTSDISEEFVKFEKLERITGKYISEAIIKSLPECDSSGTGGSEKASFITFYRILLFSTKMKI